MEKEQSSVTLEELTAAHPELAEQLRQEGINSVDIETIRADARAEAEAANASEIERAFAIVGVVSGEAQTAAMRKLFDAGLTADQAKVLGVQPAASTEATLKEKLLDQLMKTGAENPGHDQLATGIDPNLPLEEQCKAKWNRDPALREEFRGNFVQYVAAETALKTGRAKILKMPQSENTQGR